MTEVISTLKLADINVEICSDEFEVRNLTDDEIEVIIHERFSERLVVDWIIKEKDDTNTDK